jgi:hypothetical protein
MGAGIAHHVPAVLAAQSQLLLLLRRDYHDRAFLEELNAYRFVAVQALHNVPVVVSLHLTVEFTHSFGLVLQR